MKTILSTRTVAAKVALVGGVVRLSVVSVGAWRPRVRPGLGGRLVTRGVSTGTRRLGPERLPPPRRVLLLLLLLLEMPQDICLSRL